MATVRFEGGIDLGDGGQFNNFQKCWNGGVKNLLQAVGWC